MAAEFNYTQEQLAALLGKAKSTISEALSLNRLPEVIKEEVRRAELYPRRLLVEIAKQDSEDKMVALFRQVKAAGLKSDQVRQLTRPQVINKRPPLAILLEKVQSLATHLERLEVNRLSPEERLTLFSSLQALHQTLARLLT